MDLSHLNTAQKSAVTHTGGPLLIVAGAGTGKTTVITQKISYLIREKKVAPEHIVALTFTERAAREMHERVDVLESNPYADLHISTFHAFCQKLLEQYGLDIGLFDRFSVLSRTDAWLLMRQHIDDLPLDIYRPLSNPAAHIHALLDHFSKCKDELISPETYRQYAESLALDADDVHTERRRQHMELADAYHAYNQLLYNEQSLDFGDLIFHAVRLLRDKPDIASAVQSQYTHVLVDEFQDVNWAQYELTRLLGNGELTVVGDDDQSIYAFRGASVSNILRFKQDYPASRDIVLTENYRSGQAILDASYALVEHNNPDRLEVKLGISKKLVSASGEEGLLTSTLYASGDDEADAVASRITDILNTSEDTSPDDIAILVRAHAHAQPFLQALLRHGIPYEYVSSSGLFRQDAVLDCISLLTYIVDPFNGPALYRILTMPILGLSHSDVHIFLHHIKKKRITLATALDFAPSTGISRESVSIFSSLSGALGRAKAGVSRKKPSAVLVLLLHDIGYLASLLARESGGDTDAARHISYMHQFFTYITSFETTHTDATVYSLMEYLSYVRESGDRGAIYAPVETSGSINVMTVHASKGLEFAHVFIVGAVEERFPTRMRRAAIELPAELINEQLPEGDYHYQEERRLMYVAMTRAKQAVHISYAKLYGGTREKKPSRFIAQCGEHLASVSRESSHNAPSISAVPQTKAVPEKIDYPLPTSFSFSQIRSFDTCPYQYKLAHVLKIPVQGNHSFSFGNTIHLTLQKFYSELQKRNTATQESLFDVSSKKEGNSIDVPPLNRLLELYEKCWIPDWYVSTDQKKAYYEKGKHMLQAFYESQQDRWTVPIALEGSFTISVGGHRIRGSIDRVDKSDDGSLHIIDYKTGATKRTLTGKDKDQLLLYQIAAQQVPSFRHVGPVSKLTFYYLGDNIETSFAGTDKQLAALEQKMTQTIGSILDGNFDASPSSFACRRCDFRNICQYRV
jgi:DNA helicase II / ATP-dependent DNA helicase PcrA